MDLGEIVEASCYDEKGNESMHVPHTMDGKGSHVVDVEGASVSFLSVKPGACTHHYLPSKAGHIVWRWAQTSS